jgi:nucleotide-binding universal stress UspA family protein
MCVVGDARDDEAAVRISGRLAERFGSRLVLVSFTPAGEGDEQNADEAATALERLERIAGEQGLADRVEHRVEVGSPVSAAAAVAAEEAAELIVLGARRARRRRMLRSDIARELAVAAPCPVVVTPPESGSMPPAGVWARRGW